MIEALFDLVTDLLMLGSPNGKARRFWALLWVGLIGGGIALAIFWGKQG